MSIKAWLKNVFIPHEGNDYTPHSLQKAAMFGMFVLVILTFTLANLDSIVWTSSHFMVSTILPAVIIDETNHDRLSGNLAGLHENPLLDEAATLKAQDMAKHQYFAHFSPTGISPWYWFGQVGYNYTHAGENLAINFTDSSAIVNAWMNSPEHRANIMSGKYTDIGVGTAQGVYQGYKTVYVVQLFGTEAAARPVALAPTTRVQSAVQPAAPRPTTATVTAATSTPPPSDVLGASDSATPSSQPAIAKTLPVAPSAPALAHATTASSAVAVGQTAAQGGAVFSGFAATSTTGVGTVQQDAQAEPHNSVPYYWQLLTQPRSLLQLVYGLVGTFVVISLLLSIIVEMRRQQPLQIVLSLSLLMLMSSLFYLHSLISTGVTIL